MKNKIIVKRTGLGILEVNISGLFCLNKQNIFTNFNEQINQYLSSHEAGAKIIIDLRACEHVDSTGLSEIIRLLMKLDKNGGKLCLVGLQPRVSDLFALTRFDRIFDIFPDLKSARQYVLQPSL
jgi:anti-anti-sigma factor